MLIAKNQKNAVIDFSISKEPIGAEVKDIISMAPRRDAIYIEAIKYGGEELKEQFV